MSEETSRMVIENAIMYGDSLWVSEAYNEILAERREKKKRKNELLKNGIREAITTGKNLEDIEKEAILSAYDLSGSHQKKTANMLGISVRTVRNKLKDYFGIQEVSQEEMEEELDKVNAEG